LKPLAIGTRIEEAKIFLDGDPVGPIATLEDVRRDACRQPIGLSKDPKCVSVETGQALRAWEPDEALGIDHDARDGRMQAVAG
jgi:hypothetical protein